MTKKYPKVSIITVNFNGKKYLKRLFDSVFRLNYPKNKLEVIFVDNVSTDNSIEFMRKNYPKVKVIQNNVNNYCKALNLGIKRANAEYIALINNDIRLDKNWLIELIKIITEDKKIACVGSKVLDMAGKIQNLGHYELPNFYWGERGAGQDRKRYNTIDEVPSLCGAAVLYRKDVFLEVGLFDEDFVIFGEDTDMSLRLRQRGYKLIIVPTTIAYHEFHGTANEELNHYYIERNRLLLIAKHYPHRLSTSLLGDGYFTAKRDTKACGELYALIPQLILKLLKHHEIEFIKHILDEIFKELRRILNYENDILTEQISRMTNNREELKDQMEIQVRLISEKNEQIEDKIQQIHHLENLTHQEVQQNAQLKDEGNSLSNQLRQRMDEILQLENLMDQKTQQNAQLKDEGNSLSNQIREKEAELQNCKDELDNLSNQLHQRMDEVLLKDGEIIEKNAQITQLKEEFNNLSNQLHQRMDEILQQIAQFKDEIFLKNISLTEKDEHITRFKDEVFLKDGQLVEKKIEIDALKKELFGLAEQLANSLVTQEETKTQLQDKDGEIIEKDAQITQLNEQIQNHLKNLLAKEADLADLKEEFNNLSNQLRQRMDEVLHLENLMDQKTQQIAQFKDEVNSLSNQIREKEAELQNSKDELNGIYNSEGFRFVLRPLWTIIWDTRIFLKAIKRKLVQAFWFAISIILTPIFLFLSLFFLLEYISWFILGPLLKIITPKRKIISIKDSKISLVIPNYNGIACLKECLPSVFSADGFTDGQNEVLVVDDGSTDGSVDFIRKNFPKVRLIQNRRNRGFGFTCNRGVKAVKNEIVVLINNDIILTKDFLKPLIGHLQREDVFAVTPKLYAWDKKTFVWGMHMGCFKDGYIRLWNEAETGNGDRINQISPSIFAIGGAMVFRKNDFLWLGGFDHIYRPNCWEDIDISYRAWKRGLKVLYEPKSLMYHKGRATLTYERPKEIKNELLFTWKNITDAQILKNHLNLLPWNLYRNRVVFLKGFFWALNHLPEVLLQRLLERSFTVEFEDKIFNKIMFYYKSFVKRGFRHLVGEKPNILIVSRFLPYPLNIGGKIRIHTLAKLLSDRYNFILLSLIDHEDELKYIPKLKEVFNEVYPILAKSSLNLDFTSELFYPDLYKNAYSYSQELVDRLKELQDTKPLDIIHIESNELLYLVDHIEHIPVVYTEHDISILSLGKSYYKRDSQFIGSFFDNLKRIFFHSTQFKKLDKVLTLSKEDEYVLRKFFPEADITLVPTGVDLKHFSLENNFRKSKKLIFVGHYRHYPNEDAIVYFTKKIFPLIRKRIPDVELLIVGSNPTANVENLSRQKNVVLVGEVDDVKTYLEEAVVFVNSVRISAGIKGKVLEAMATGVPVVSTTVGSSGIDAQPEKEILIADSPRKFAKQVIRLLSDDELRKSLISNARHLVENKYDWFKSTSKLDMLYKSLLTDTLCEGSDFSSIEKILDRTTNFIEQRIEQLDGNLTKPERGPEELHIELTYDCNSKCIMCDLWDYKKRLYKSDDKEISLEEIKRFVEESRLLQNTKAVVLSGGEPFFRSDIVNLCGVFSKQIPNSSIGILTNGVNTETIVTRTKEVLDRFQPRSLWLGSSLDGIGKEHDKIRGTEGAFLALCKTINRCKKELPSVKLSATFTLTPYNIDQLIPAKQFADKEGIEFFAQFVVPKEAREEFIWTPQNLNLAEKEIMQIIQGIINKMGEHAIFDSIDKIKDKNSISQLYYWSHLIKYQTNPQRFFKKCVSGSKFAMFNPYGDLFFCPTHKGSFIGNVREQKFDNLWMSNRAQHLRSFINDSNCHCWLVCIVFPVLEKALSNR